MKPKYKENKKVIEIFSNYLVEQGYRKTNERYAILNCIYNSGKHLDADEIFKLMVDQNYRVSKATIYNTLEILLECKLIKKHQFNKHISRYEKSLNANQHDHIILDNNEIMEFCDPRIQQIKETVEKLFNIEVTGHILYFYGKRKKEKSE